jgi:hypothetical protein
VLIPAAVALVEVLAALLPTRYWTRLGAVQPRPLLSGLATGVAGTAAGFAAFVRHTAHQADAATSLTILTAAEQLRHPVAHEVTSALPQTLTLLSMATFLATPVGLLTVYAAASGMLRAGSAYLGDPIGDPALTLADAVMRHGVAAARRLGARVSARRRFGPIVTDRVVGGSTIGADGVDVAVLASRRKTGWTVGTMVVTPDGCYRIVSVTECRHEGRAWTAYLLCRKTDAEILRRSVRYDVRR